MQVDYEKGSHDLMKIDPSTGEISRDEYDDGFEVEILTASSVREEYSPVEFPEILTTVLRCRVTRVP